MLQRKNLLSVIAGHDLCKIAGENLSIWWYYEPSDLIMKYLKGMRYVVHHGLLKAEEL